MKKLLILGLTILIAGPSQGRGQVGGNVGYAGAGGRAKAEASERSKRALTKHELPPNDTTMFVDASVLMNVKADEYVAIFGISQEGESVAECIKKMDATVKEFSDALKPLEIGDADLFVDFVAQNKIFGFEVSGDLATEKLVGFELKKNISIHYKDHPLLDRIIVAAARSKVFDLIKVTYVVKDPRPIQERLAEEAARIIKQKTARYDKLLGIKLRLPAQVYADRSGIYEPTELYDSYTAAESEDIGSNYYRQKYTVKGARKNKTFYFNALNANGFDEVINPVVIEPVVQFTLYLKLRYQIAPSKAE